MSTDDQGLPEEIRNALLPVRRDLATAGVALTFENARPEDTPPHLLGADTQHAWARLGGRVVGQVAIDLAKTAALRTWYLADQIQDYVLETPWESGKAVSWPSCLSGHAHPMKAEILGDDVWWVCPRELSVRVRVGWHPGRFLTRTDITNG